jgi:streptogramin lyase
MSDMQRLRLILRGAISAGILLMGSFSHASEFSLSLVSEAHLGTGLGGKRVPKWSGGTLVLLENDGVQSGATISLFDRQGQRIDSIDFTIPDASAIVVRDFARGLDGTVALCGSMKDRAGEAAAFVAWAPAGGRNVQTVRTSPYSPMQIAVAPDGTIWTQGTEARIARLDGRKSANMADWLNSTAAVFRRFDQSGRTTGAFVPQSEIANPESLISVRNGFAAAEDKVVWYSSRGKEYIEISASGAVRKISDLPLPERRDATGFAVTSKGDVLVSSTNRPHQSDWRILRLDPAGKVWAEVSRASLGTVQPRLMWLYGADGEELVAGKDWVSLTFLRIRE